MSIATSPVETRPIFPLPYAASVLVLVIAFCTAVEWYLGILGSPEALPRLLAASRAAVLRGEAQRLLTASFFHLSVLHSVANSVGVLIVGSYLEFRVGTPRFVVIALSSAAGSILGSVLIQYVAWVAGASGMLYGLYGALAALIVRYWNDWTFDYQVPRWLAVSSTVALLVVSHVVALRALPEFAIIDQGNHWSGFAVGALATAFLTRGCPARELKQENRGITRIALGGVILFLIAFVIQALALWIQ